MDRERFVKPVANTSEMPKKRASKKGVGVRFQLSASMRAEPPLYYALLATTLFLVAFGVMMVLSASFIEAHNDGKSFFASFAPQAIYAVLGLALMMIASRLREKFWDRFALSMLFGAIFFQVLAVATPLGVSIGGNRNWVRIGSIVLQPSEAIKVFLIIWLGIALERAQPFLHDWREVIRKVLPVPAIAIFVVLLGRDLGTVIIMVTVLFGALYFAGIRLKYLVISAAISGFTALVLALVEPSRRGRIFAFFGGTSDVNPDVDWQINNAHYALATGGIWGVGLGNSYAKWSWLPSADTDFIFAIIGEELGIIGATLVLVLFSFLAFAFLRVVMVTNNIRVRVTTAAIMVWIIGQAFVNIGVVLGLIPVLGVPLPFVSSGGSALVSALVGVGIVMSFIRRRPDGSLPLMQ